MTFIDCKSIANKWKNQIKKKNISASLCVIQVGNDPASEAYIRGKKKDCEELGFGFEHIRIDNLGETYVRQRVKNELQLASFRSIFDDLRAGCILQLPLPDGISLDFKVEDYLPNDIDVDGFNSSSEFFPCTPEAIVLLLEELDVKLAGKHCVIAGYSNIVGKPLSHMMSERGATVTVCRSRTPQNLLYKLASEADIFISAVGKAGIFTSDIFKPGAIVIDVGINRTDDGLCGDVEIVDGTKDILITPVPGGVGLLTRAVLMKHIAKTGKEMTFTGTKE